MFSSWYQFKWLNLNVLTKLVSLGFFFNSYKAIWRQRIKKLDGKGEWGIVATPGSKSQIFIQWQKKLFVPGDVRIYAINKWIEINSIQIPFHFQIKLPLNIFYMKSSWIIEFDGFFKNFYYCKTTNYFYYYYVFSSFLSVNMWSERKMKHFSK